MRCLAIALWLVAGPALADCALPKTFALGSTADCGSEPDVCRWTFALGDAASRANYDDLQSRIKACAVPINATRDQGVNHPDFYDAWIYEFEDGRLSVSIKDKSALGQTFVVLRRLPIN